jgi:Ni,Fe-hydrogenase III large subunit
MKDSVLLVGADEISLGPTRFMAELPARLAAGCRPLTFYGRPGEAADDVVLTAILVERGALSALRTTVSRHHGVPSLAADHPSLNIFEREIHEECGLEPTGHPWLKPVRRSGTRNGKPADDGFYRIDGKEVHEVAVGPIHAGVIEPGHFRFMCLGETVHHLEIRLGYQHRGVEALLLRKDPATLGPLVETIAGDTSVGHAWAYCAALEGLCGVEVSPAAEMSRGVALELERIAMHLAGLAGLATDVAFLPGGSTYGRLRTTAINTSMLICGSRFGRGWLRPGGVCVSIDGNVAASVRANLQLLKKDLAEINELFLGARSVRHRLQGVGVLSRDQASAIGVVGAAARASSLELDARVRWPGQLYGANPVAAVTEPGGDCLARARVRIREIDESIRWVEGALERHGALSAERAAFAPAAAGRLAVSVREGWRGEVVHCLETGSSGGLLHYKVQDPSLRNWFGLALALRGNDISDFPVCNKSFDLSYCGNDL